MLIKKKKIIFFLPTFADGGAESVIISLANQFLKTGKDISFIVGNSKGKNKLRLNSRIKLVNFKKDRLLKCFTLLTNKLVKLNPTTVVTTLTHSNLLFCFLKRLYNFDFQLIIRETNIEPLKYSSMSERLKFIFLKYLKKLLYNSADYILAINSRSKKDLLELGINKKKIKLFNNPSIKENFIFNYKKKIKDQKIRNKKYLIYVGRMVPHKNLDFLIKVFYELSKTLNIKLLLIGQGSEIISLKNQVKELNIKNKVIFKDYVLNPLPYIKNSSLYLSFSDFEGQPNSVIQSLACGTKTIIKYFPGIENIQKLNNLEVVYNFELSKISNKIAKILIKKSKNNINKKIIKDFGEDQYFKNFLKLINE